MFRIPTSACCTSARMRSARSRSLPGIEESCQRERLGASLVRRPVEEHRLAPCQVLAQCLVAPPVSGADERIEDSMEWNRLAAIAPRPRITATMRLRK